jgi:hypothetical protein
MPAYIGLRTRLFGSGRDIEAKSSGMETANKCRRKILRVYGSQGIFGVGDKKISQHSKFLSHKLGSSA